MFILDDDYNISKLLRTEWMDISAKRQLLDMFNLGENYLTDLPDRTTSNNPFTRFRYPEFDPGTNVGKRRQSVRERDLPFAQWMCENVVNIMGYAGYAATSQSSPGVHGVFHQEFIFCNAFAFMDRDLSNVLDWQHFNKGNIPNSETIKTYMNQLGLYRSYNVNFHAGDLLQHSIWTLLFSEDIMRQNAITQPPQMIDNLDHVTAFCAFIHDIGKMYPDGAKKNEARKNFRYFSISNHPWIGAQYILGELGLPVYDANLNLIGYLNIKKLFEGFGFKYETYKAYVATVVNMHWDFGEMVRQLNESNWDADLAHNLSVAYLQKIKSTYNPGKNELVNCLYSCLVVSIADVLGSQPYGVGRLEDPAVIGHRLNKQSYFFPWLTNMPKKYRGGNIDKSSNIGTIGIKFANNIMQYAISL